MTPMPSFANQRFWADAETRLRLLGAILAGALSLVISQVFFQGAYVTADEGSYVFQANCFRDGVIARPLPPIPPAFRHLMIIQQEGIGWMSRYTPGHTLWLLPGVILNVPRLMSALAAGLSVWFLIGCARFLSIRAGIVLLLLLCSPYFLLMHGTLLSHTSAHLFFVITLWAYLAWQNTRQWRYAVLCGLSWAFMFLIRNYTAVLIGVPFAIHALADGIIHRNRKIWIGLAAAALCALLGVAILMLYNYLAVGDCLASTYLIYDPSESLGFGLRHYHYYTPVTHTWQRGVQQMLERLALLDRWVFGVQGSLVVIALLWLTGWTWPWSLVLAGAVASVWVGYIYFYSNTVDNIGPYYYFETLPCLLLAAALGIQRIWSWWNPSRLVRRWVVGLVILGAVGLVLVSLRREGQILQSELASVAKIRRLIRQAPPESLIFLSGITSEYTELVENPRGLASQPLVAHYVDDAVSLAVAQCFPERTPYIMRQGAEDRLVPFDRNRHLEIVIPAAQFHGYTGQMETLDGGPALRVAREGRDGSHWMACRNYAWIYPGRFTVNYEIAFSNVAPDKPVTLDIVAVSNDRVLATKQMSGSQSSAVHEIEFHAPDAVYLEPRVHFGGSGTVILREVRIREKQR